MASQHLPNYLRTFRKCSALTQEEVAFLLGTKSGGKVCRYERFAREPGLQTVLAYEVIFKKTISELFPGLYQQIEGQVKARAKKLADKNRQGNESQLGTRKRQTLAAIIGQELKNNGKHS